MQYPSRATTDVPDFKHGIYVHDTNRGFSGGFFKQRQMQQMEATVHFRYRPSHKLLKQVPVEKFVLSATLSCLCPT